MKTHHLIQGSPEWLAYRAQHFNASDAPAMMGVSPNKSRSELLHELAVLPKEHSDFVQKRILASGHQFEALARPLAEQIIGEDLYPVTGSNGRLSASFDGLNLDESEAWEHKRLNADLRECFAQIDTIAPEHRDGPAAARELPLYHRVQMEHQLLVSGASRILFMASEWAQDGALIEERHCWYYPDPELRAIIVAGWQQFEKDLAAYVPQPKAAPAPTGKAPETLPALRIEINGAVTASNLAEFKATALAAISSVNRNLQTDQDFADAEKAVKWCGEVESRLSAAKEHALSQTASIDELFRTMDDIGAEARRVRLDLEKLVKARKEAVKAEIISEARRAYELHEYVLRTETGGPWIVLTPPDWAGAIKGLRTVDSIRNAVDTLLAASKIKADDSARRIRESLRILSEDGAGFEFLFADKLQLIGKSPDDLRLLVAARISDHKAAEARRLEAERERIRVEEEAKAQRTAEEAERQQRAAQEAAAAVVAAAATQSPSLFHPVAVEAVREQAKRADEPATLKLGTICERLGFTVTAAFLADVLHVPHRATDKAAKLWRESDWPVICRQLASHVSAMAELHVAEAA